MVSFQDVPDEAIKLTKQTKFVLVDLCAVLLVIQISFSDSRSQYVKKSHGGTDLGK